MMFVSFFLFMTGVWGYSQSAAGLAVTPGPLTVIPVAVLAGRLAARMGTARYSSRAGCSTQSAVFGTGFG
jgi:hypothetical protein